MRNGVAIILLIALILQNRQTDAQISARTFPAIGEQVPAFNLNDVDYYSTEAFSDKEIKGKWFILDFWDKGCVACVQSFPKLNELQAKFKDHIQILLVARNDHRRNKDIRTAYEKYRNRLGLNLPIAYDSSIFNQFGIQGVPHVIVVAPNSIVYAITNGGFLTEGNIKDLIQNKSPAFKKIGNGYGTDDAQLPWQYAVTKDNLKNVLTRSALSKYVNQKRINAVKIEKNANERFFQVTGSPLYQLFNLAWIGETGWTLASNRNLEESYWRYPVLEMKDSSLFDYDYNTDSGLYNYSLIAPPKDTNKCYFMKTMQEDLSACFGYHVRIEKRRMPYWRLQVNEALSKNLISKSTNDRLEHGPASFEGIKISPRLLLTVIQKYTGGSMPFIDETNIKEWIDVSFSAVMTDIEDVRNALKNRGLILEKGTREFNVLVITDSWENKQ